MKRYTLTLFFLIPLFCFSQKYQPIDTVGWHKKKENLEYQFKFKFDELQKQMKLKFKGKNYKYLKHQLEEIRESTFEQIHDNHFFFHDSLQSVTKNILKTFNESNFDSNNTLVAFLKNDTPNAFTTHYNALVINLGLIDLLDNTQQYAGVLAHEVAHIILKHSWESVIKTMRLDTENEKKIKTLKRKKYNKYDASFKIFKNLIYKDKHINRLREYEADSLGFLIYKKSSYHPSEYINSLRVLKELEESWESNEAHVTIDSLDYISLFNLPNLPFKSSWLEIESFQEYNYDLYSKKLNQDSIKSHPELEKRILKLQKIFPELKTDTLKTEATPNFKEFKKMAYYERLPNRYILESYGSGLYIALRMFKIDSENKIFIKKWIGNYFEAIYNAKKAYRLNRYVEQLNPKEQSRDYQQFLSFIWNLNLDELKEISNFYNN